MARKKGSPIAEKFRKWLKNMGAIDDRHKNALEGMVAKEKRKYKP